MIVVLYVVVVVVELLGAVVMMLLLGADIIEMKVCGAVGLTSIRGTSLHGGRGTVVSVTISIAVQQGSCT